jgi:hypothetical protein
MSRRCEISVAEDEYLQPRELKMIDERMITDFACLDAVYVDDCAIAINLGHTVNLLFYRNMPLFRDGVLGFEHTPALSLVLPWSSAFCKSPQLIALRHG